MSPEQHAEFLAIAASGKELELHMESFFLFGDILLDTSAKCVQFDFGPARSASLIRWTLLKKNGEKYAAALGLTPCLHRSSRRSLNSTGSLIIGTSTSSIPMLSDLPRDQGLHMVSRR